MQGSMVPMSVPTYTNKMLCLHLQRHIVSSLEPCYEASCCEQVHADFVQCQPQAI